MAAIISLAIGNNSLLGFESASAQLQSLAEQSAPLPLQYPSSQEIQTRCVEMLARLTHSPAPKGKAVGTSAIGRWALLKHSPATCWAVAGLCFLGRQQAWLSA